MSGLDRRWLSAQSFGWWAARIRSIRDLPIATGSDLDAIARNMGLARVVESDAEFRARLRRTIGGPVMIPALAYAAGLALLVSTIRRAP